MSTFLLFARTKRVCFDVCAFSIALKLSTGYIKAYIILPSTIWGIARNSLVDAGIINPYSMAVRFVLKTALNRGRAGVVGKGLAVWNAVEIEESTYLLSSLPALNVLTYVHSD